MYIFSILRAFEERGGPNGVEILACKAAGASRCGVSATEKIMAEAEKRFAEGNL